MSNKDTDLQKIKELIEIMKANDLVEIEIKHGEDKIFLKRFLTEGADKIREFDARAQEEAGHLARLRLSEKYGIKTSETLKQPSVAPQQENLVEIKSPLVGTFYAKPSPDSDPYVEIGSQITPQTVICIIEAMKVMNEIKAESSGTIVEILVRNGEAVEYGQVLFKIKPD